CNLTQRRIDEPERRARHAGHPQGDLQAVGERLEGDDAAGGAAAGVDLLRDVEVVSGQDDIAVGGADAGHAIYHTDGQRVDAVTEVEGVRGGSGQGTDVIGAEECLRSGRADAQVGHRQRPGRRLGDRAVGDQGEDIPGGRV